MIEQKKKELQDLLIKMRKLAGYDTPFIIARELHMATDTIYKIETGVNLPTRRTLIDLFRKYKATPQEVKAVNALIDEIKKLKRAKK
jgi:hypothetical protein